MVAMPGIVKKLKGRINLAVVSLQVASERLKKVEEDRAQLIIERDAAILDASRSRISYAELKEITGIKTDVSIRAAIKRAKAREELESGGGE